MNENVFLPVVSTTYRRYPSERCFLETRNRPRSTGFAVSSQIIDELTLRADYPYCEDKNGSAHSQCMNSYHLGRSLGTFSPQALQRAEAYRFLNAIDAAPGIRFDGRDSSTITSRFDGAGLEDEVWAHKAGVNCIAIDKFEGR